MKDRAGIIDGRPLMILRRCAVNLQDYRKNRASFPLYELAKYQGQWVAFSMDGRHIIAGCDDLGALDRLVLGAGEDPENVALERIELEDSYLGGAELSCG
jgi:hypothetical protein